MTSRFILPFADVGSGIKPSSGAKLFFYADDGVTLKDTYSDQLSTPTPNANPVIADSVGVFGDIYLSGSYKVTLQDKNGSQIFGGVVVNEYAVGNFETNLINDLSQASEFDTVADMVASPIDFPVGKRLNTVVHNTTSNLGGASYIVRSGSSPNIGSPAITGGKYAELQQGNVINVMQWGCLGDGTPTDHSSIQAAEDYARPLKRKVFFPEPAVEYAIAEPLIGGTFTNWEGENANCFITKYGNTTSGLTDKDAPERVGVVDVMDVDAVVVIDHANDAYAVHVTISNLYFQGASSNVTEVVYGIYNPRSFFFNNDRMTFQNVSYGYFTYMTFQATFDDPYAVECSVAAFKWADDGSGGGAGTSVVMNRPYAQNCGRGYDLYGLVYSHINTPSCDRPSDIGYFFTVCRGLTVTSLGIEAQTSGTHSILVSGGRVTINGVDDRDVSPTVSKFEMGSGARVVMNSCGFTDYVTPASALNLVVSGGSNLVTNNCQFPTNGNSFVSYGGGSTRTDVNNGVTTITNSAGSFALDASGVSYQLNTGLTAFAGGGQGSATLLSKEVNNVSTVASAGDSVILPVPESSYSKKVFVINSGVNSLDIFPNIGAATDATGTNLADTLAPNSSALYVSTSPTRWWKVN